MTEWRRLKGGHTTSDPRLDRLPEPDARNHSYPIRELIGEPRLRKRSWRLTARLDQGQEGACVGFAWAHELHASPQYHRQTDQTARAIYLRAQQLDEWPGEQYAGTSVLAGAKAVTEFGLLVEYRWAWTAADVLATLSAHGPVVIGVNWYEGMFDTDAQGFLHVTGEVAGGHAVCLRGVGKDRHGWYALGRNSWGAGWGVRGDFKVRQLDLERLLGEGGDACVPVVRR